MEQEELDRQLLDVEPGQRLPEVPSAEPALPAYSGNLLSFKAFCLNLSDYLLFSFFLLLLN